MMVYVNLWSFLRGAHSSVEWQKLHSSIRLGRSNPNSPQLEQVDWSQGPVSGSPHVHTSLTFLAGVPATRAKGGTFFVTTAPAATTEYSPSLIPGQMTAPAPIEHPLPTTVLHSQLSLEA